ncbi:MAG: hypothetical protein HQM08_28120 [Candidatus Riflebacteria bacterium]|nr:hypothetical protein [Candidatus Riflebacteria bacterium]
MMELSGFVRAKEAAKALGIAVSTFWLRVQQGEYEPGIKLSKRVTVWKASSIQDLIDHIAATSPQQNKVNPCPKKG